MRIFLIYFTQALFKCAALVSNPVTVGNACYETLSLDGDLGTDHTFCHRARPCSVAQGSCEVASQQWPNSACLPGLQCDTSRCRLGTGSTSLARDWYYAYTVCSQAGGILAEPEQGEQGLDQQVGGRYCSSCPQIAPKRNFPN